MANVIAATALSAAIAIVASCGARTGLPGPEGEDGEGGEGAATTSGGERRCGPTCTVGHGCCVGSCDGAAVETPTACCECLPGEVDTRDCDGRCGG